MDNLYERIKGGVKEKLGGFAEQRQLHKESVGRGKTEFIKMAKSKMAERPFVNPHLAIPEDMMAREAKQRGRSGYNTWDFFPEYYEMAPYTYEIIGPMPSWSGMMQQKGFVSKLNQRGSWLGKLTMPELKQLKQNRLDYWKNAELSAPSEKLKKEYRSQYWNVENRAMMDYYPRRDVKGRRINKKGELIKRFKENRMSVKRGKEDVKKMVTALFSKIQKRIRS